MAARTPSPRVQDPAAPDPRTDALIALSLAALVLVTFSSAVYAGFVRFDDLDNIYNNQHIRSLSVENLRWMFSASLLGHFQPLTWFTYALDYQLWGLNPRGYHITNIAIHA